jgi:hypothetical protein
VEAKWAHHRHRRLLRSRHHWPRRRAPDRSTDRGGDLAVLGDQHGSRRVELRGAEPLHYAVDGGPGLPRWNPGAQSRVMSRSATEREEKIVFSKKAKIEKQNQKIVTKKQTPKFASTLFSGNFELGKQMRKQRRCNLFNSP